MGPERVLSKRERNWEESSSGVAGNGAGIMRVVPKTLQQGRGWSTHGEKLGKKEGTRKDGLSIEERNNWL